MGTHPIFESDFDCLTVFRMASTFVDEAIAANKVVVFSKTTCPFCTKAKSALRSIGAEFEVYEIERRPDCSEIQDYLREKTGARSVPRVFINGQFYGGGDETAAGARNGDLKAKIGI